MRVPSRRCRGRTFVLLAVAAAGLAVLLAGTGATAAHAQMLNFSIGGAGGSEGGASVSARIIQGILLVTVLSVAPGLLVMTTSFTRIVVVFSLLRSAIGVQQSPPNMVLIGLAMFLTAY